MSALTEELEFRLRRREPELWPQAPIPSSSYLWMDAVARTDEELSHFASLANSLDGTTAYLIALGSSSVVAQTCIDQSTLSNSGNGRRVQVVPDVYPNRLAAIDTTDADFIIISPNPADQAAEAAFELLLSRQKQRDRYLVLADESSQIFARAKEFGIRRLISTSGVVREPWRALEYEGIVAPAILGSNLHDIFEGARSRLLDDNPTPRVDEIIERGSAQLDLPIAQRALEPWFSTLLATSGIDPHTRERECTPQRNTTADSETFTLKDYGAAVASSQLTVALLAAARSYNPFDPSFVFECDAQFRATLERESPKVKGVYGVEDLLDQITQLDDPESMVRLIDFSGSTSNSLVPHDQELECTRQLPPGITPLHGPSALHNFGQLWLESSDPLQFMVLLGGPQTERITLRNHPFTFWDLSLASAQLFIDFVMSTAHSVVTFQL
jgi:hypothetical protein